ncbi:hypothetical protein N9S68_00375, partial [bacterium]|nr:hypothetical protein [bacterium]
AWNPIGGLRTETQARLRKPSAETRSARANDLAAQGVGYSIPKSRGRSQRDDRRYQRRARTLTRRARRRRRARSKTSGVRGVCNCARLLVSTRAVERR